MKTPGYNVLSRHQHEVNTDSKRRCYNGCHFSSEMVWSAWEVIDYNIPKLDVERRLKFWRELNDYAISQRGESARSEFKAEECVDVENCN